MNWKEYFAILLVATVLFSVINIFAGLEVLVITIGSVLLAEIRELKTDISKGTEKK